MRPSADAHRVWVSPPPSRLPVHGDRFLPFVAYGGTKLPTLGGNDKGELATSGAFTDEPQQKEVVVSEAPLEDVETIGSDELFPPLALFRFRRHTQAVGAPKTDDGAE